jgi:FixJ family two-component response regulator
MDNDLDDKEIMNETFVIQASANHPSYLLQKCFKYLQAIEKDKELPSLIITDLKIPAIRGFELLQALKWIQAL